MKNTLRILCIIAFTAVIGFAFSACELLTEVTYTVTFNSNGGSAVTAQEVFSGGLVTKPIDPTKAGNTFAGWCRDADLTTLWNFNTNTVTENITLYAKWTVNIVNYTVTFNSNSGIPASSTQTVISGQKAIKPTNFTKVLSGVNQILEGWYKDNTTFLQKWDFDTDTVTGNVTLYAKWTAGEPGSFVVTFESNGGSAVAPVNATGGQKVAKPSDPTKAGYTFAGWCKEEALTTSWNFDTELVVESVTLYAKWTVVEIPVLPADYYVITGSGTTFSATKGSTIVKAGVIQDVINEIRTHSAGAACIIHFGDGESTLNTGTTAVQLNNTGGTWGAITLKGKITSAVSTTSQGTIMTDGAVTVTSEADIANTATGSNGRAIYQNSGNLNITGGTISLSGSGYAIYANSNSSYSVNISGGAISAATGSGVYRNGAVKFYMTDGSIITTTGRGLYNNNSLNYEVSITGGVISATTGYAVYNYGGTSNTVTIGGDAEISATTGSALRNTYGSAVIGGNAVVKSETGYAVYHSSSGKVTVTGNAIVSSANVDELQGTIYVYPGIDVATLLDITGGTITNTAGGYAVNNLSSNVITLGGSPSITGRIYTTITVPTDGTLPAAKIALSTATATVFAPAAKKYMLDYRSSYVTGMKAVPGGANFAANFELYDEPTFKLLPSGSDLLVAPAAATEILMVAFNPNGGSAVSPKALGTGDKVTAPTGITRSGYAFDGWYKEAALTNQWNFTSDTVTANITLFAKWNLTAAPAADYVIYNNGSVFYALKGTTPVGTPNTLENVLTAIRADASSAPCSIHFGSGTAGDFMDTSANPALFNGSWGNITLLGKITSSNSTATIQIANTITASVESKADVSGSNGAIRYVGTGSMTISAGTISASVINAGAGTLTINGGSFSALVSNTSTGTTTISSGTISRDSSPAVSNTSSGSLNITGDANISSNGSSALSASGSNGTVTISGGTITTNSTSSLYGTIDLNASCKLIITGGTIQNTSTAGYVIYGSSIYSNTITLGGNPTINGRIRPSAAGRLSVALEEDPTVTFAPSAGKTYTIVPVSATIGDIAVTNGAAFLSYFTINATGRTLSAVEGNLVIQ